MSSAITLGDNITISYDVNNKLYQEISCVTIQSPSIPSINHLMIIYHTRDMCTICDNSQTTQICNSCKYGLNFQIPSQYYMDIIGLHIINITSNDTIVSNNTFEVNITECNIGHGVIHTDNLNDYVRCGECDMNSISINFHINQCVTCNTNQHYQCYSSSIVIDYNSWITIYNHSKITENTNYKYYNQIFTESSVENEQYIISTQCPSNQCCQYLNGCNYTENKNSLCAINRDVNIPLCGECRPEYSETFGNNLHMKHECAKCDDYNYIYLMIPIIICIPIIMVLLFFDNCCDSITGDKDIIYSVFIALFRNITYYYQLLFFVFNSSICSFLFTEHVTDKSNFVFMSIMEIFSLHFIDAMNTNYNKYICVIPHLNSFSKQLWSLTFIPMCMLCIIIVLFILFRLTYFCGKCLCSISTTNKLNKWHNKSYVSFSNTIW
eukprot:49236_1